MEPEDAVELALVRLKCSQKELAIRLGVSPTQVSKWKNGEYMSVQMQARIRELTKIGDANPLVVLAAGSIEDAEKWKQLILKLAKGASNRSDTGYDCEMLRAGDDSDNTLVWPTIRTLKKMGVVLPKPFPKELETAEGGWDEVLEENPYSALILKIFDAFADVDGFFVAYVQDIFFDDEVADAAQGTGVEDIHANLISLAATKIEVDLEFAPNFPTFVAETKDNFKEWLLDLKKAAIRVGVPLCAELMDLLHCEHDDLGAQAENEKMGINARRLHPDIYMNELLDGVRTLRQVLPAIMKKLKIDQDFKL